MLKYLHNHSISSFSDVWQVCISWTNIKYLSPDHFWVWLATADSIVGRHSICSTLRKATSTVKKKYIIIPNPTNLSIFSEQTYLQRQYNENFQLTSKLVKSQFARLRPECVLMCECMWVRVWCDIHVWLDIKR